MDKNKSEQNTDAMAASHSKNEVEFTGGQRKIIEQIVSTETLMNGKKSLGIRHGEELYQLRITNAGRLILTK